MRSRSHCRKWLWLWSPGWLRCKWGCHKLRLVNKKWLIGLPTKHSRNLPSGVLLKTLGKQPIGAFSRLAGKAVVARVELAGNPLCSSKPQFALNFMGNHWWKILWKGECYTCKNCPELPRNTATVSVKLPGGKAPLGALHADHHCSSRKGAPVGWEAEAPSSVMSLQHPLLTEFHIMPAGERRNVYRIWLSYHEAGQ